MNLCGSRRFFLTWSLIVYMTISIWIIHRASCCTQVNPRYGLWFVRSDMSTCGTLPHREQPPSGKQQKKQVSDEHTSPPPTSETFTLETSALETLLVKKHWNRRQGAAVGDARRDRRRRFGYARSFAQSKIVLRRACLEHRRPRPFGQNVCSDEDLCAGCDEWKCARDAHNRFLGRNSVYDVAFIGPGFHWSETEGF